jgi:ParB-like chromosome segregation protein Spo0J
MTLDVSTCPLLPLPLDRIADDATFMLRAGHDSAGAGLTQSIRRIGVTTPPVVQKTNNGEYRLVSGFARLTALRETGQSETICRVFPPDVSPQDLLLFAVEDNMLTRGLNLVEQSLAVNKLLEYMDEAEIIETLLPLLGRKTARAVLQRLLHFSELPRGVSDALASGAVPEKAVLALEPLSDSEQELAVERMIALGLSTGNCRDFAKLVAEICGRDKITLDTLLADFDDEITGSELIEKLRAIRNPILDSLRRSHRQALAELGLPARANWTPPPNFEGQRHRMTLDADNAEGFRRAVREIAEAVEAHPDAVDQIFSPKVEP